MPRRNRSNRWARASALSLAILALTVVLAEWPAPADASTRTLAYGPGGSVAALGERRTTALASVAVVVPSALPLDVGLQFRSSSRTSGYRAALAVGADGSVSGTFTRVSSGRATTILPSTRLGLTVRPGQTLRLQATVAGSSPVWLYLRAWRGSDPRPQTWQLGVSDSSGARYRHAGKTYLWASGTQAGRLSYGSASVSPFSAGRAAAVGVTPAEPGSDTFGIGVIPDTQAETNVASNRPFLTRTRWMVANRGTFDLRYVLHTGDMTNWGWLAPGQLRRAKAAMDVLRKAGIPYDLTVGNHDTRAVGWNGRRGSTGLGGAPYMHNPDCRVRLTAAQCKSSLLVRHSEAFNSTFPLSSLTGVGGAYDPKLIDNNWTTFRANDTKWLVLTLELWPRKAVVEWAKDVVASHPSHNVIIQTHSYLDRKGRVWGQNGGYGATSPKYLYRQLVSAYPNVKLVFSGHTGRFTSRSDQPHGNPVLAFLGNDLGGPTHDPVRMVSINTRTGDVFTTVHDPMNHRIASATSGRIEIIR